MGKGLSGSLLQAIGWRAIEDPIVHHVPDFWWKRREAEGWDSVAEGLEASGVAGGQDAVDLAESWEGSEWICLAMENWDSALESGFVPFFVSLEDVPVIPGFEIVLHVGEAEDRIHFAFGLAVGEGGVAIGNMGCPVERELLFTS